MRPCITFFYRMYLKICCIIFYTEHESINDTVIEYHVESEPINDYKTEPI